MSRGIRPRLAAAAIFLAAPTSLAMAAVQYPPDEEFDFGSLLVEANASKSCYAGFAAASELQFYISYSQFVGSGGPYAEIALGAPMSYDLIGTTNLQFGTTADLEFTSPTRGTISFDSVSPVDPAGKPAKRKRVKAPDDSDGSYPFTVTSSSVANGIFTFEFTIAFPGCPVTLQGKYR